jgi:protein TonB
MPPRMKSRSTESIAGAVVVALHAAAIAALLGHEPARTALLSAPAMMVSLVSAPSVQPPPAAPIKLALKPPPELEPPPLPAVPIDTPPPAIVVPPAPRPSTSSVPAAVTPAPRPEPVAAPIFAADYLDNPAPPYPAASRRAGEQGRVVLRVLVNARGGADEVELLTSSGYARLDAAAREAVRRWRFVAARRGGGPGAAGVQFPS